MKKHNKLLVASLLAVPAAIAVAGSSHAYALLTYNLLKGTGIDVQYVTGLVNGEVYSWNVVKLNGKMYHFDAAGDDNETAKSTNVSYRYFLARNGIYCYCGEPYHK